MVLAIEQQHIPVLMYHSISSPANSGFRPCTVSPELFDMHLSYLKQHHYTSITVTQLSKAMSRGGIGLPPRPVLLTFDDGYADFYTAALPILQYYGCTATLYVATAYIGNTSRWLQYPEERSRPMLTKNQLREISACGIECGAHTHTHPALDMVSLPVARDEIVRSKDVLEECLGHYVSSFAYPYGYYNARLQEMVQICGFMSACAIRRAMSSLHDNPYALARLAIWSDTDIQTLATTLLTGHGPLVASPVKRTRTHLRLYVRSVYGKFWSSLGSLRAA